MCPRPSHDRRGRGDLSQYPLVIAAPPITATTAPIHAAAAGRIPSINQSSGKIRTGVVEDNVDTTPTGRPERAYSTSVMPAPIPNSPLAADRTTIELIIRLSFLKPGAL